MELLNVQKCRSFEEETYWKHFGSKYFCCILPDDFHDHLVLPQKFADNMINKLPNKVSLFGPSGAIWDVTLTKANNVAFVGDAWKEFVEAYALKPTYLLMFKYKRNMGFQVFIIDPVSLCEKEDGYFVKKPDKQTINSNNDDDKEKKRSSAQAFGTGTEIIEDDESEFVSSKRVRKDTEVPTWRGETSSKETPQKSSSGTVRRGGSRGRGRPRRGRISVSHIKAKSVGVPKRNKAGKEQPVVENRESDLDAEEHIGPESGEGNLETVQSPKLNETAAGDRTNGSPKNGGSILEIVHGFKCYQTRGKKAKQFEAAKEHGIGHSPMSTEVIDLHGDESNMDEAAKKQNGLDSGASTLKMVSSDTTIKTRARTRSKLKLESDSAMGLFAKEYVSKRLPLTEKEKESALQRAKQGLLDESFIAVMRPTNVYRNFSLNIPSVWIQEFLPCQNHEVVLRVGDKTWPASFYYYGNRGGLSGVGWKKFVLDNHLEEFDVCVVKLASQKGDATTVLDVDIFRVIPEIVSPTLAVPF